MDAAVLSTYGTPQFGTFDNPVKLTGTEIVDVTAAVISNLDLLMASGQFYLKPAQLPSVAGVEGVGRRASGRRVYFYSEHCSKSQSKENKGANYERTRSRFRNHKTNRSQ